MNAVTRSMVWWPGIDNAVEQVVRQCKICQSALPSTQPAPLCQWRVSDFPWERVHLNFATKEGHMFLIAVDAYSKWLDVNYAFSDSYENDGSCAFSVDVAWASS